MILHGSLKGDSADSESYDKGLGMSDPASTGAEGAMLLQQTVADGKGAPLDGQRAVADAEVSDLSAELAECTARCNRLQRQLLAAAEEQECTAARAAHLARERAELEHVQATLQAQLFAIAEGRETAEDALEAARAENATLCSRLTRLEELQQSHQALERQALGTARQLLASEEAARQTAGRCARLNADLAGAQARTETQQGQLLELVAEQGALKEAARAAHAREAETRAQLADSERCVATLQAQLLSLLLDPHEAVNLPGATAASSAVLAAQLMESEHRFESLQRRLSAEGRRTAEAQQAAAQHAARGDALAAQLADSDRCCETLQAQLLALGNAGATTEPDQAEQQQQQVMLVLTCTDGRDQDLSAQLEALRTEQRATCASLREADGQVKLLEGQVRHAGAEHGRVMAALQQELAGEREEVSRLGVAMAQSSAVHAELEGQYRGVLEALLEQRPALADVRATSSDDALWEPQQGSAAGAGAEGGPDAQLAAAKIRINHLQEALAAAEGQAAAAQQAVMGSHRADGEQRVARLDADLAAAPAGLQRTRGPGEAAEADPVSSLSPLALEKHGVAVLLAQLEAVACEDPAPAPAKLPGGQQVASADGQQAATAPLLGTLLERQPAAAGLAELGPLKSTAVNSASKAPLHDATLHAGGSSISVAEDNAECAPGLAASGPGGASVVQPEEAPVRRLSDNPLFVAAGDEGSSEAAAAVGHGMVRRIRIQPPEYHMHLDTEDEGKAGGRWTYASEDWDDQLEERALGDQSASAPMLQPEGTAYMEDVPPGEGGAALEPGDSMAHVMTLRGLQAQLVARQLRQASQSTTAHARELQSVTQAAPSQGPAVMGGILAKGAHRQLLASQALIDPGSAKPWSLKSLRAAGPAHNKHGKPMAAINDSEGSRGAALSLSADRGSLAFTDATALPLLDSQEAVHTGACNPREPAQVPQTD